MNWELVIIVSAETLRWKENERVPHIPTVTYFMKNVQGHSVYKKPMTYCCVYFRCPRFIILIIVNGPDSFAGRWQRLGHRRLRPHFKVLTTNDDDTFSTALPCDIRHRLHRSSYHFDKQATLHYYVTKLHHTSLHWHYVRTGSQSEDPGYPVELLSDCDGQVKVPAVDGWTGPDRPGGVSFTAVATHRGSSSREFASNDG